MEEAPTGSSSTGSSSTGLASRIFPGGRVKLPRLAAKDRGTEPQINVVGTAFVRAPASATLEVDRPHSGFSQYFTYESLFEEPAEDEVPPDQEDPYKVLRVSPTSDWAGIVHAHRALVKEFHPDRFAEHPEEIREQADREIKRINAAYTRLNQTHPDGP